jgi:activating signal cointegrator complex subunit 3
VAGEEVDRQSIAEFLYGILTSSQDEIAQFEAIQEVLVTFTRSNVGQLRHLAQKLSRFDKGSIPTPSRRRMDASAVERNMDQEFGHDMSFVYPLDQPLIPPARVAPKAVKEDSLDDRQESFFIAARKMVAGDFKSTASSSSSKAPVDKGKAANLCWFRDQCEIQLVNLAQNGGGVSLEVNELMAQVLETLESKKDVELQDALCQLLGFEALDFISSLLEKQSQLLQEWSELQQQAQRRLEETGKGRGAGDPPPKRGGIQAPGPSVVINSQRQKQEAKAKQKEAKRGHQGGEQNLALAALQLLASIEAGEDTDQWALQKETKPASSSKPNVHQSHFSGMGLKVTLPEGTTKKVENGYEKVVVPPNPPFDPEASKVKFIEISELPKWAQVAFKGTKKLNTIQSIVFNAAFGRSRNLLICAPTGAGKTNIAVLTILRLIGQHMDAAGGVGRDFKVVYMAPMKALVAEVVEKFQQRLGPLGIMVAEMTGDMSLTKKELEQVHVIVTVPEKWDVMTRNTVATGGANDDGLQKLVQLIIIDEVHLLNEDRGAIIETNVARSLRYQELSGQPVRLVALSATLPNYADVASFLRVDDENLFYFDASYRPIPLEMTFLGITEKDQFKRSAKFNEVAYEAALEQVRKGHQCMVFVHSRVDTYKTAAEFQRLATDRCDTSYFEKACEVPNWRRHKDECQKSRNSQVRNLFDMGLGMHHAGMLRADRTLSEKMFLDGAIRILFCTATLAWGVNLPARAVIIKGTNIYDASAGGFKDLGILDVQQIFGRAGRPGFDTEGSAMLITEHGKLNQYLRQLLHQTPIESKFNENMTNSLNAEIAIGAVTCEKDAADWLRYTYLYVRFFRTPQMYGITEQDYAADPTLEKKRREMVNDAAMSLNKARLVRVDNNKNYNPTDLGRVASRFYIDWQTAEAFSLGPVKGMSDEKILALFGKAAEFTQLKVRDDEIAELEANMADQETCPINVLGGATNVYGKVSILLQTYLSRRYIATFSLVSDCNYVLANASRLFRALFEITMTRVSNMSEMSDRLLEWCKMWISASGRVNTCFATFAIHLPL